MKKYLLVLTLFSLFILPLVAQNGTWQHFNSFNSGMPFTSVLSIAFDKQGNTWFGTDGNGLVRLDASQTTWTIYTTTNSTLPSNGVYSVAVDKKGVIWAGTNAGVVQIKNGVWTVFGAGFAQVPFSGRINDVSVDSSNRKWFCLEYLGVASFNDTTWNYTAGNSTPPHVQFSWHNAFHPAGIRYMNLTSTTSGLWHRNGSAPWAQFTMANSGLGSDEVRWIDIDPQGLVWLGTGNGLAKLQNGTITSQSVGSGNDPQTVVVCKKDKLGTMWVGTYGSFTSPAFRLDNGTWTKLVNVVGNVSVNSTFDIKEDRLGRIWFGTSSGAFVYTRTTTQNPVIKEWESWSVSTIEDGKAVVSHSDSHCDIQCFDPLGRRLNVSLEYQQDLTQVWGLPTSGWVMFRLSDNKGKVRTFKSLAN